MDRKKAILITTGVIVGISLILILIVFLLNAQSKPVKQDNSSLEKILNNSKQSADVKNKTNITNEIDGDISDIDSSTQNNNLDNDFPVLNQLDFE